MSFIPVPNCIKVVLEGTMGGQEVVLTISLCKGTAVTPTDLANAGDAMIDWWINELAPLLSDSYDLLQAIAYDLTTSTSPVVTTIAPGGTDGTRTTGVLSNNVALVQSFRTANRGRSGRGRIYVPGLDPTEQVSPVQLSTTYAAGFALASAEIDTYANAVGLDFGVISRYTNGVARVAGLFQAVTAIVVDTFVDSQRRRLANRGI